MTYNVRNIPMLTDTFANNFLDERDSRKLAHNTFIRTVRRGGPPADVFAVTYHSTDIATLIGGRWLVLDTGGWRTMTTLQRMNALIPGGMSLNQKDWTWYLTDRDGNRYRYEDRVIIDTLTGTVHDGNTPDTVANWFETTRRPYPLTVGHLQAATCNVS